MGAAGTSWRPAGGDAHHRHSSALGGKWVCSRGLLHTSLKPSVPGASQPIGIFSSQRSAPQTLLTPPWGAQMGLAPGGENPGPGAEAGRWRNPAGQNSSLRPSGNTPTYILGLVLKSTGLFFQPQKTMFNRKEVLVNNAAE